jgi:hypothetical protein
MHLDLAAIIPICSLVGVMQIGENTLSRGILKVFRLDGTCSSQNSDRLWGIDLIVLRMGGCGSSAGATFENARWKEELVGALGELSSLSEPSGELC